MGKSLLPLESTHLVHDLKSLHSSHVYKQHLPFLSAKLYSAIHVHNSTPFEAFTWAPITQEIHILELVHSVHNGGHYWQVLLFKKYPLLHDKQVLACPEHVKQESLQF